MTPKEMRKFGKAWGDEAGKVTEGANSLHANTLGLIGSLWQIAAELCERSDAAERRQVKDSNKPGKAGESYSAAVRKISDEAKRIAKEVRAAGVSVGQDAPPPERNEGTL